MNQSEFRRPHEAIEMAASADDYEREPREVKNHLLFEIATEVAHRGMSISGAS